MAAVSMSARKKYRLIVDRERRIGRSCSLQ
jgi:hypothetical protein